MISPGDLVRVTWLPKGIFNIGIAVKIGESKKRKDFWLTPLNEKVWFVKWLGKSDVLKGLDEYFETELRKY